MMKIATLTAALALCAGTAFAADLTSGGLKDSGIAGVGPIQGIYFEMGVGYGFSQDKIGFSSTSGGDLAATGTFFNARLGYDKAGLIGGRFGAGLYVQGSNAFDVNGSIGSSSSLVTSGNQWGYGVGGKLFYDYGGGQAYVLLGYEGQDVSLGVPEAGTGSRHTDGILWGGGVSMKLTHNAYIGLEAVQIDRGTISGTFGTGAGASTWSFGGADDRVSLRVGISSN